MTTRQTATLHIEHAITDFGTWQAAFARFGDARAEGGVVAARIHRPLDDDAYVVIQLDFATVDEAQRFERFLRGNVWSTPASAPALAGAPVTRLLRAEPVAAGADPSSRSSPVP